VRACKRERGRERGGEREREREREREEAREGSLRFGAKKRARKGDSACCVGPREPALLALSNRSYPPPVEIVDPPLLGHPPDPRRPVCRFRHRVPRREHPWTPRCHAVPSNRICIATDDPYSRTSPRRYTNGDGGSSACCPSPLLSPSFSFFLSRTRIPASPARTGRSCPLRFPLRSSRSAFAGALSSFLPSRSRLRFFGSRVADPPARPPARPSVLPFARPLARNPGTRRHCERRQTVTRDSFMCRCADASR